jgi:tRNA(Ile)-lysidine synthase
MRRPQRAVRGASLACTSRAAAAQASKATARTARYAALATVDADVIALAHHADDQAETLLLQLLRGAGPAGLAAMPTYRSPAAGPALLRPLLSLPRAAIDAYARAAGLEWVDDESNADTGVKRNFIRRDIAPMPRGVSRLSGHPRAGRAPGRAAELRRSCAPHGADALGSDAAVGRRSIAPR